jgi:hypothetical protein
MSNTLRTSLAALSLLAGSVHAALQPGDLAFTAFNADEDGFAVVALREIAPFDTVYFTDNEWSGGAPGMGKFNTGENTFVWVTGAQPIAPGTVVRFSQIDQAARSASVGAFALFQSGAPGFSASGDTLFAFTGNAAAVPDRLLAALSTEGYAGSSLAGSGLAEGVNAVSVGTGADYAEYAGPRSGLASFGGYAALVNDASLWQSSATGDFAATVPNLSPFAVAAVPEPQTYALLATGLSLIGWRLRRRALARAPWPVPSLAGVGLR